MKEIFIAWGSSDIGGHDLARHSRPLHNPDDVFLFNNGIFHPDPKEPVFTKPPIGSTFLRYFADKLSSLTSDDVAFMSGFHGHHWSWHDGISAITPACIRETIKMLQPALDDGWHLGGIILATGPGDAENWNEVHSYLSRYHNVVEKLHDAFDAPVFNMQTFMPHNNTYSDEKESLVQSLRNLQLHTNHSVPSNPNWHGVPGWSGNSHLDVAGQLHFGYALAHEVFDL